MGKAEETKAKILDQATEILATKGYAVSTTKEIADASGVSEGTIFKYFKSKENLLAQIFKVITTGLRLESEAKIDAIIANKQVSTTDRLREIMAERQVFFDKHRRVIQIMIQEMPVNPLMKKMVNDTVIPVILKKISVLLEEGKEKGEIRDLPIRTLQLALLNTVLAPIVSGFLYDQSMSDDMTAFSGDLMDIFIKGIETGGDQS